MTAEVDTQEQAILVVPPPRVEQRSIIGAYLADYARLVRTATLLLNDVEAAQDVVQEAYVRLDRRAGQLTEVGSQQAYVRQIVVNLSRSALRRRVLAVKYLPRSAPPAPGADTVVMAALRHDELVTALRRLPTRQREALVLRFYEDHTEAEIAVAMGCRLGTVKATLSQAKKSLARLLGDGSKEW